MAVSMVAQKVPVQTLFETVKEILRLSLHAMLAEGEKVDALERKAERIFLKSMRKRLERGQERFAASVRGRLDRLL